LQVRQTQDAAVGVKIERARADDLSAVTGLLTQSRLPTDGVAACIEDFFVARNGADLVGAIGMEARGHYALLRSAAVSESRRGRGLGRALVERLLSEAQNRGVRSVFLLTTTAEDYFPGFGFSRVDRETVPAELTDSPEFQGACPASATVMRKDLALS